jgi:hypothetical protein
MDRFKILKGLDPFKKNPQGDGRKYIISGTEYHGWLINDDKAYKGTPPYSASVVLKVPDNFLRFVMILKKLEIEIQSKDRAALFVGKPVKNSPYDIKAKPSRILFIGTIVKVRTPNWTIA